MDKEFIDVDYFEVSEKPDDSKKDVIINADPVSAFISGMTSIANGIINSSKEKEMCRQQEKTKRMALEAQMKLGIEKIHAKRDTILNFMNNQHEKDMIKIKTDNENYRHMLSRISEAIDCAISLFEQTGDCSKICTLIELNCSVLERINNMEIKSMESANKQLTNSINSLSGNNIAGLLE